MLDISVNARWTLAKAKNHLSDLVDAALDGRPQVIARRGDPAVVVIAASALPATATRTALDVLLASPKGELPLLPRSKRKREKVAL